MPDARISLLRDKCESLLAQLIQPPIFTSVQSIANEAENNSPEAELLLELIHRSFREGEAGQRSQHEMLKAARQLGECYAAVGAEVSGLIGPLLQACQEPGKVSQSIQQRQTELLACAVEAYLGERTRHLAEQAQRDPLTQLFNRAAFDQCLHAELARARRYGRALSLLLFELELDQSKLSNEHFDNAASDEVLQQFANLLESSLRQSDLTFRYGRNEFVILLPETAVEAAGHVAQRLCERLQPSLRIAQLPKPIGFSCSTASFPAEADTALALLKVADVRLHESKHAHQAEQS
jgi:diguanylate cyclase (GGDEF)-like protein